MPLPALLAAALLVAFLVGEGRLRRGAEARSLDAGAADRGSTRRIGVSFGLSIVVFALSAVLAGAGRAVLPEPTGVQWVGVGVMASGLALRVWSALVLGAAYTRTLRIAEGQRLVRAGPYRVVRHPGYAADVGLWLGAALASGEALAAVIIVPMILWAYALRIAAEERMLEDAFGEEFRRYARTTWRLVPLLF